jgi:hypothetical protein
MNFIVHFLPAKQLVEPVFVTARRFVVAVALARTDFSCVLAVHVRPS